MMLTIINAVMDEKCCSSKVSRNRRAFGVHGNRREMMT